MKHIDPPSRRVMALVMSAPLLLAACTTAATETTTDEPAPAAASGAAASTEAPVMTEAPAGDAAAEAGETDAGTATWLDIELADARTGETFTLASLGGGVVAIEPMAVWCTNCKVQQDNVKSAYPLLADAGVTYISLGIDPGESAEALARYAERRGYEWTFVQSSNELSRALADSFGPQILSAPSTPLIVLDAAGEVVVQEFGFHSSEQLVGILEEASAA